ncbi:D-glucuronyl C5-epimerase family protein [Sphingosinicella sp. LY1275]|uniref:D-glucuronyl C5-epimerase family protein n=1 Tax=Sphingosinicella sp. LY1275 TaxID=3095379 RepID=UPI002ADEC74B|nr:D-glucuronyl C5-epimerase family protein [Sphingosinicella sp. LY1275]MEA1013282.1 D-glucuronyl C5-epimerase family protein [Sphingosinicella sp. LY1275]
MTAHVPHWPEWDPGDRYSKSVDAAVNAYKTARHDWRIYYIRDGYNADGRYVTISPFVVLGESTRLDAFGVPQVFAQGEWRYNPTTIANFALWHHTRFVTDGTPLGSSFWSAVAKLESMIGTDGALRYDYSFGGMPPGWVSAMAQGQVLSVFARAYNISGDAALIRQGNSVLDFMLTRVEQGGTLSDLSDLDPSLHDYISLNEYAPEVSPHTLNGFMFAMFGLYDWSKLDLASNTDAQAKAATYFEASVETVSNLLPYYDVGGFSAYDLRQVIRNADPAVGPTYHKIHIAQLVSLYSITGRAEFLEWARKWAPDEQPVLPVAFNDLAQTDESASININVLANDGDPTDCGQVITKINGVAAKVGTPTTLASGALATLNSDGTITYDPNDRFNYLVAADPSSPLGSNGNAAKDYFRYTTDRGVVGTVTVTITGLSSPDDMRDRNGADTLFGTPGPDVLNGYGGHDIIDGGSGVDLMVGGDGDDEFYVDDAGDIVREARGGGFDRIWASVDYTLPLMAEIELVLALPGAIRLTGNEFDNYLIGSSADNFLYGGLGNDALAGGRGNDLLDGGGGDDVALFAGSRRDYQLSRGIDGLVQVTGPDGADKVVHIEHLRFADGSVIPVSDRASKAAFAGHAEWTAIKPIAGEGLWYIGDFDGDLRTDVFRYAPGVSGAEMFLSTGTAFQSKGSWTAAGNGADKQWYVGDFNGDGRDDIFRYMRNLSGADMFLSTGTAFAHSGSWTGAGHGLNGRWFVGDFNGDGRDDIFRYLPGTSGADMFLSTGTSFQHAGSWTGAGYGTDATWYLGDYDGDGRTDVFRMLASGVDMFLSTGTNFRHVGNWTSESAGPNARWSVGDYNGDGRDDILRSPKGQNVTEVFLSTSSAFQPDGSWTNADYGAFGWMIGDFNGDATDDLLRVTSNGTSVLL